MTAKIYIVVDLELNPIPSTAALLVGACIDRASLVLGGTWEELKRKGYRVAEANLTILGLLNDQEICL